VNCSQERGFAIDNGTPTAILLSGAADGRAEEERGATGENEVGRTGKKRALPAVLFPAFRFGAGASTWSGVANFLDRASDWPTRAISTLLQPTVAVTPPWCLHRSGRQRLLNACTRTFPAERGEFQCA
jgi:hypothetical protein